MVASKIIVLKNKEVIKIIVHNDFEKKSSENSPHFVYFHQNIKVNPELSKFQKAQAKYAPMEL